MGRRIIALTGMVVLALSTRALKAEEVSAAATSPTTTQAAPAVEVTPAMAGLDYLGAGDAMRKLNLRFTGYIQGGYTYGLKHGSGGTGGNTMLNDRYFDTERGNHFQLDQIELALERVIADKTKFDIGGKVEWIYGMDSYLLHANGLDFYSAGGNGTFGKAGDPNDPIYQFNLAQAYVDVNFPILGGLNVRSGLFYSIVGYETINPSTTPFYSHSFLYTTQPTHQAGFLATQTIDAQWTLTGGIFRGEEQGPAKDNNGAVSGEVGIGYAPNERWTLSLNMVTGPEMAQADFPNSSTTSHYTTLVDFIATWAVTDRLTLAANADVGATSFPVGAMSTEADNWYGLVAYVSYKLNDYFTFNGRTEWLHDDDSIRVFFPAGGNANVYEITLGTTITPCPSNAIGKNLKVRPEIRWDHAEDKTFNNFNGTAHDREQVTIGCDVIFTF